MQVDTNLLVTMTDANQNFSKVVRLVDDTGLAVIMKNNKPRYVLVDFDEYEKIQLAMQMCEKLIGTTADQLIENNLEAFRELAK